VPQNADDLLEEADILLSRGKAPRAYLLAFAALEELAKSEVVADYFNDMVSHSEFKAAFQDHGMKVKYLQRVVDVPPAGDGEFTIDYEDEFMADQLLDLKSRTDVLYVHYNRRLEPVMPAERITPKVASTFLKQVREARFEIGAMSSQAKRIGTNAGIK